MRKLTLVLLIFFIGQTYSTIRAEEQRSQPIAYTSESIGFYERIKHELLQLEDIKIGDGPIAAAGRKVTAEITVRYSDGKLVYEGPAVMYWGLEDDVFIHNSPREPNMLSLSQTGIILGLNGMKVGGKRRIHVPPNLVCYSGAVGQSLDKGASPGSTCGLVYGEKKLETVQKLLLIVDATLTAACKAVFPQIGPFYIGERCRDVYWPERKPDDPIWRFYVVETASPYKF